MTLLGALLCACALLVPAIGAGWQERFQDAVGLEAQSPHSGIGAIASAGVPDELVGEPAGEPDSELGYVPDVVIAQLADDMTAGEIERQLSTLDFIATKHVNESDMLHGFIELDLAEGIDVETAIERLSAASFATSCQPNFVYHVLDDTLPEGAPLGAASMAAQEAPIDDPRASEQWALEAVHAYSAWDKARSERRVTVAVLDTGLDSDHEDFADADGSSLVVGGHSIVKADGTLTDDPDDYEDVQGHGTHVAGIIAAGANNGKGVAGVSYNANVMPVRIIDSKKGVTTANAARGLDYVVDNAEAYNVKVANLSFGTTTNATGSGSASGDELLRQAVERAHDNDILVVWAAGNGGSNGAYDCYPCDADPEGIGVINVQRSGSAFTRSSSSNYNKEGQTSKELSAPGTSILSTTRNGSYGESTGTSMAAPCVSGVAALVFAADPGISAQQVKQALVSTAQDIGTEGFDLQTGYGMVDAQAAVGSKASWMSNGNAVVVGGAALELGIVNPRSVSWSWASSDESVVTVDASGRLEGVSAGVTTVTATSSDGVVLIREIRVYDTAVSGTTTLEYGTRTELSVSQSNPSSAWVWSSSDESVATVGSASGIVVGTGVGTATITVSLRNHPEIAGSVALSVTKADLARATLSGVESRVYAGRPATLVNLGVTFEDFASSLTSSETRQLSDGTGKAAGDYEVSYVGNEHAGEATVVVTAKADSAFYAGSKSTTFEVKPASMSQAVILFGNVTYDGTDQRPIPASATFGDAKLALGIDYTLEYRGDCTNAGLKRVIVSAGPSGDFTGSSEASFTISKKQATIAAKSASKTYDGKPLRASDAGFETSGFVADADVVSVSIAGEQTNAGSASSAVAGFTLSGSAQGNYDVSTEGGVLEVEPASLESASVSLSERSYVYDGAEKRPDVVVKMGSQTLSPGSDYAVAYEGNVGIGSAKVMVSGMGNYTGEKAASFAIEAPDSSVPGSSGPGGDVPAETSDSAMFRLYNPFSGEHFYTSSEAERDDVAAAGWAYEGVGWTAPSEGDPVFRLYNPYAGDHHYTTSAAERESLVTAGWSDEGTGWYSDVARSVLVYREYNPNEFSCNHNYTTDWAEHDRLVTLGWIDEGVAWYSVR